MRERQSRMRRGVVRGVVPRGQNAAFNADAPNPLRSVLTVLRQRSAAFRQRFGSVLAARRQPAKTLLKRWRKKLPKKAALKAAF